MIKQVTREEAKEIVKNRVPAGQFYLEEAGKYIGVENSTHDAQVEFFKTKEECIRWMMC